MLALSTSWKSNCSENGVALLDALMGLDIRAVELEYRITDAMYHQMRKPLLKSGLKVMSIHNFFPAPTHIKGFYPGGDMFVLSHPDGELRQMAIDWTCRTIETANDLEASVVVLHCGFVDMTAEVDTLHAHFKSGEIEADETKAFMEKKQNELADKKPPHIDSLMFSLDQLVHAAEKQGIKLGLENRYHYHQLPGPGDFDLFFKEFKGAPIGYWHDTGHAHVSEVLGLAPQDNLLEKYADHLLGFHLHDAVGLDDHLPPGSGEIDFEKLKASVKSDTLQVLELKPGTHPADVLKGLDFLRKKGFG